MDGHEESADLPEGSDGDLVAQTGRKCFVIMPYGVRKDPVSGMEYDFEATFDRLIEKVLKDLHIECIRSDKVSQTGLIHKEMIEHIINADIVIVDITMGNPNVMYELGVRHTARRSGTVIIRRQGSSIPFNISGMRAMDYTVPAAGAPDDELLEESRRMLAATLQTCLDQRAEDSLVHTVVPGLNVALPAREIPTRARHIFAGGAAGDRQFEIIIGDISNIDDVDAWVNPENTRMEMARMHDSSVSAHVRYYGAYRDRRGQVRRDAVWDGLRRSLGGHSLVVVEPGTVVKTSSGALRRTNNVKWIFHVAAHHGEPGKGYQLIKSFTNCVTNALDEIDTHNGTRLVKLRKKEQIRSVLFPLFGNRGSARSPQDIAYSIVQAASEYVRTWPDTEVQRICFLAYTDRDFEQCETAMQRLGLTRSKICRGGEHS